MESAQASRPEPTSAGVWAISHRRLTIGLLLTISITAFEALAVATVLPATAMDLGGGDLGWYGWVFSGFMLANLVGIPAAGVLADRGGPARPFVVGCALFGAEASHPVVAVACVAAGVAVALPALRRLLPEGTMSAARGAPAALATKALVTFAFFGAETFLPLALTVVRDEPMRVAGFALTAGTLGWTAGAWVQDRLAMRVDRVALVRTGLALTAVAVAGSAYVLVAPWPAAVAIVSWTLAGLGIGISYSTSTLIVFELTPGGDEGAAASALQLANVLGVALGAGVGGAVLAVATAHGHSQGVGIAVVDAVMFAVAVAGFVAAGRSGRPVSAPSHGRVRLPVAS